tara:strand:- start:2197 stop:3060 length:864 start_codon:yes stop_codon:yes gene_type:complete
MNRNVVFAWSVLLAGLFSVPFFAACSDGQGEEITINFKAMVGDKAFSCSESYADIGTGKSPMKLVDFRFYVHKVRVINAAGEEVPVTLKEDGKWQSDRLALLDFEDHSGTCAEGKGNEGTNTSIVGYVPKKDGIKGLKFIIGVPEDINHLDAAQATAPLDQSTSMFWSWNRGYRFLRFDAITTDTNRYAFHFGSIGCTVDDNKKLESCKFANRVEFSFDSFDPSTNTVVADIDALLKEADVQKADGAQAPGCMSTPETPGCAAPFKAIGLTYGQDAAPKDQTFLKVE